VVESGTLLRCYTSKRGIEGSNPSSSAPKAAYLQDKRKGKEKDRGELRPGLHHSVHQRNLKGLLWNVITRGSRCRTVGSAAGARR
jgi:hypothetical protein